MKGVVMSQEMRKEVEPKLTFQQCCKVVRQETPQIEEIVRKMNLTLADIFQLLNFQDNLMIVCEKRYTDHEKSIETKIGP